jgi:hypothetical protein
MDAMICEAGNCSLLRVKSSREASFGKLLFSIVMAFPRGSMIGL